LTSVISALNAGMTTIAFFACFGAMSMGHI